MRENREKKEWMKKEQQLFFCPGQEVGERMVEVSMINGQGGCDTTANDGETS